MNDASSNGHASLSDPGPILDTLHRFFETSDWGVDLVDGDPPVLQTGFEGESEDWMCYAVALEGERQVLFYSVYPGAIPPDRRPAAGEYISRVNFDLPIGNFEMSYDTGEVRVKTSLDVEDDRLSVSLVRNLVTANVVVMNRYLPGLLRVVQDDAAPGEAL